jgi:choline-sulfatase
MSAKQRQPNVVFIMADQMAAPALPFYGHALVKTPHLAELAGNGVVFDAAYCNSPICAPSRFSLLTARTISVRAACDILSAACTSNGAAPREQSGSAFP